MRNTSPSHSIAGAPVRLKGFSHFLYLRPSAVACWISALLLTCVANAPAQTGYPRQIAPGITQVGFIQPPQLSECSGVVASRKYPGILWVHTDGGSRHQSLHAIQKDGSDVAHFLIVGAKLEDWEDLASDDTGALYIGDLGNNAGKRAKLAVYKLAEPNPAQAVKTAQVNQSWELAFPGKPFDCESLFVSGTTAYVISKVSNDKKAGLYSFSLAQDSQVTLKEIGKLSITSPVTAAQLSPDSQRLAVLAKNGAYLFNIQGQVNNAIGQHPTHIPLRNVQIEGCTFVPEGLLVTAESRQIFIFTLPP